MGKAAFADWLQQSKGDMPDTGSRAVLSDWFDIGVVTFAGKTINVGDRWYHGDEGDVTLALPAGKYRVAARGASFGKHRRVAGARVFAEGRTPVEGKTLGEIGVDSWGILIGDLHALYAGLSEDEVEAFQEKKIHGTYADGCEIVTLKPKGRTVEFVTAFTGLGSGGYPATELRDGKAVIGVQVDFIPAGLDISE